MKLLYGTGNAAKYASMKERLSGLDIELISLLDIKTEKLAVADGFVLFFKKALRAVP